MKRELMVLAVLLTLAMTVISQTQPQMNETMANTKEGLTSPAAAAAMASAGHVITQEEKIQAVKDGKASRCAVLTDPPGAEVYVDGNKGGVSPMVFFLFRKDTPRTVTLKLAGYKTVDLPFIPNGKDIPISVRMEKLQTETVPARPAGESPKADAQKVLAQPKVEPSLTVAQILASTRLKETTFRDVRAFYPPDSKVMLKVSSEYFSYSWHLAKEKKGRYIPKGDGLASKYAGQMATVVTVQLEENSLRPAHRIGPTDDDVLEPYFSIVLRFEDGTIGMANTYLISARNEIVPAQALIAHQSVLRAGADQLSGKVVFAIAESRFYYPDLTVEQAMSIAHNFMARVDIVRNIPLLQPLQVTNVGYLKQADALLVSLKLPDGRDVVSVVTCNGMNNSCFENLGSHFLSSIPSSLTAREIEAVQMHSHFPGMSQSALYMSIGYPEKENDYGRAGKQLVYYGGSILIYLDDNGNVTDTQHFDR